MSDLRHQRERDGRCGDRERSGIAGRFGVILVLLFVAVFFSIAAPEGAWSLLITTNVLATTLGMAMVASGVSARAVRAWLSVAVLGIGASIAIALTQESRTAGGYLAATSLLLTAARMGAIARRVRKYVEISDLGFFEAPAAEPAGKGAMVTEA